jgi:hypothetical protein
MECKRIRAGAKHRHNALREMNVRDGEGPSGPLVRCGMRLIIGAPIVGGISCPTPHLSNLIFPTRA